MKAVSAAALAGALGAGLLLPVTLAAPAQAHGTVFTKPSRLVVAGTSTSGFTAVAKVKGAKKYRVYAATTKREVNVAHYRKAPWHSRWSRSKAVTITGLPYRTEPYYYRYAAKGPGRVKFSTIQAAYLAPATPTSLRATLGPGGGTTVVWSAGAAESFVVAAATDPGLANGRRTWTVHGGADAFTPYGLTAGGTYYVRVRAVNGTASSGWSAPLAITASATSGPLRLMTYNLLWDGAQGDKREGGETVAPWSDRKGPAAALVRSAAPDAVAVQEGSYQVGSVSQAQSLATAVGRDYVVAPGTAVGADTYVLYRTSAYTARTGGSWSLGPDSKGKLWYATYAVLVSTVTREPVVVVSSHLASGDASDDDNRAAQSRTLIAHADALAAQYGAPLVYGGDFNSHEGPKYPLDGPGVTFAGKHLVDAYDTAQSVIGGRYNSANQYRRTAPASYDHIDHLFAGTGVAVSRWQLVADLDSSGRFRGVIPSDHNPLVADFVLPS